jgi:hypothetical protein
MDHQNDIPKRFKSEPAFLKGGPAERDSFGIASPGLGGLADKIRRNLDDYGWRITIQKTLAYLVRSVYFRQVYRIYRINLGATKPLEDSGKRSCREKSRPGNCAWLRWMGSRSRDST